MPAAVRGRRAVTGGVVEDRLEQVILAARDVRVLVMTTPQSCWRPARRITRVLSCRKRNPSSRTISSAMAVRRPALSASAEKARSSA
jgi:hypothetical protein